MLFALLAVRCRQHLANGEAIGTCQTIGDISCYSETEGFITCVNDVIVYRDCDPDTVCQEGPGGPYCSLGGCNVQIDVTLIPVMTQPMPVTNSVPKLSFLPIISGIIENVAPDAQLSISETKRLCCVR